MERSYQPRRVTMPIVPDYLAKRCPRVPPDSLPICGTGLTPFLLLERVSASVKEQRTTEYPANGSSDPPHTVEEETKQRRYDVAVDIWSSRTAN